MATKMKKKRKTPVRKVAITLACNCRNPGCYCGVSNPQATTDWNVCASESVRLQNYPN